MKRTTVLLPDDLAALLEVERNRRGVSAARVVRSALEAYLRVAPRSSPLRIAAIGRAGGNIAQRMEELLEQEWGSAAGFDAFMRGNPAADRGSAEPVAHEPRNGAETDTDSPARVVAGSPAGASRSQGAAGG